MHPGKDSARASGFTLIELMITVVVVAIGVALAVPAWENLLQKRNLTSAAEEIASMIVFAQSEAIKRNEQIGVNVFRVLGNGGEHWCVGLINQAQMEANGVANCWCSVGEEHPQYCSIGGETQVLSWAESDKIRMDSSHHGANENHNMFFRFDPVRGIKVGMIANSITILTDNNRYRLQVDASPTGRVRICNPDDSKKVPGFDTCVLAPIAEAGPG